MSVRLSYAQADALRSIGREWAHTFVASPTLDVLERRGLIEVKVEGIMSRFVRLKPAGF